MKSEPEWQLHLKLDGKPPRLVMRRKVDGEWEVRDPTPEEVVEYIAAEAW